MHPRGPEGVLRRQYVSAATVGMHYLYECCRDSDRDRCCEQRAASSHCLARKVAGRRRGRLAQDGRQVQGQIDTEWNASDGLSLGRGARPRASWQPQSCGAVRLSDPSDGIILQLQHQGPKREPGVSPQADGCRKPCPTRRKECVSDWWRPGWVRDRDGNQSDVR